VVDTTTPPTDVGTPDDAAACLDVNGTWQVVGCGWDAPCNITQAAMTCGFAASCNMDTAKFSGTVTGSGLAWTYGGSNCTGTIAGTVFTGTCVGSSTCQVTATKQ
ncbi:MAG: hypothetical protein ABW133_13795, partial [Polyangiaceae bacterium]